MSGETVSITIELEAPLHEALQRKAAAEQRSISDIVNDILRPTLAEYETRATARQKRPLTDFMAEIWAAQEARGHVPPTREEVDRYLREERASWGRP